MFKSLIHGLIWRIVDVFFSTVLLFHTGEKKRRWDSYLFTVSSSCLK